MMKIPKLASTNTIIFKTALWFSVATGCIMVIGSIVLYLFFSNQYYQTIRQSLLTQFASIQQEYGSITEITTTDLNEYQQQWFFISVPTVISWFIGTIDEDSDKDSLLKLWFDTIDTQEKFGGELMVYTNMIQGTTVHIGRSIKDFEDTQQQFITILIVLNGIFVITCIIISFALSRRILRPITQIVEDIISLDPSMDNLPHINHSWQLWEIALLTSSFDQLTDKIKVLLTHEREFLQDASHELRTPLMGIMTSMELIDTSNLTAQQIDKFTTINALSSKLKTITDSLLFLTRDASTTDRQLQDIDLSEIITQIIASQTTAIDTKQLTITITGNTIVQSNHLDIVKVCSNLIDNAIKYTPEGGSITITMSDYELIIQDTGIGMSKEFVGQIGRRFMRDVHALQMNYDGIWLGISIVSKIMSRYGWAISYDSVVERWTTVTIIFDTNA